MENIEYLRLLLNGFINHNKYFKEYIERELIKAKEKHIGENEFYDRCFDIIKFFESEFDKRLFERKRELYQALNCAKNGNIVFDYTDPDSKLSNEERCKESVIEIEKEIESLSRHNFPLNLLHLTKNEFIGHLYYNDVLFIEKNIVIQKGMFDINNVLIDLAIENVKKRNEKSKKPFKTFPEYILHKKNDEFAELLKNEFNIERGKSLKLMIDVLIKKEMFTIENRQRENIYNAMKEYFNRDIGTKQSIFDYKYEQKGNPDFESIELRIDNLLDTINKI